MQLHEFEMTKALPLGADQSVCNTACWRRETKIDIYPSASGPTHSSFHRKPRLNFISRQGFRTRATT